MAQMTTTDYIVYRYGSNAANQSMTPVMPVGAYSGTGRTAAERRTDAERQAAEEHTVYANQFLSAVPLARCSASDAATAWEHQTAEQTLRGQYA